MMAVLLHYAAPVRRAGINAVEQCVTEKPQLAGVLSCNGLMSSFCGDIDA